MKVLITGATGFIGSHLQKHLREVYGIELVLLSGKGCAETSACDLAKDDLDPHLEGVDSVVHLAQSANYRDFPAAAQEIFDVNVLGLQRLLISSQKAGVKKFINFSSGNVYAPKADVLFESDALIPEDFYGTTKLMGEELCRSYDKSFEVASVRLFCPYGPGQVNRMIPNLVSAVLEDKELYFAGDKGLFINPIFISDVVSAIESMLKLSGSIEGTFNLGGPEAIDLKSLSLKIAKLLGRRLSYRVTDEPIRFFTCDSTAFTNKFAPKEQTRFDEGLSLVLSPVKE